MVGAEKSDTCISLSQSRQGQLNGMANGDDIEEKVGQREKINSKGQVVA